MRAERLAAVRLQGLDDAAGRARRRVAGAADGAAARRRAPVARAGWLRNARRFVSTSAQSVNEFDVPHSELRLARDAKSSILGDREGSRRRRGRRRVGGRRRRAAARVLRAVTLADLDPARPHAVVDTPRRRPLRRGAARRLGSPQPSSTLIRASRRRRRPERDRPALQPADLRGRVRGALHLPRHGDDALRAASGAALRASPA